MTIFVGTHAPLLRKTAPQASHKEFRSHPLQTDGSPRHDRAHLPDPSRSCMDRVGNIRQIRHHANSPFKFTAA